MHGLLAAVTLAAAMGAAAPDAKPEGKQIKLASPGLTPVNLKKDRVEFFANHFAQEMNNRGIRVITAQEVSAVLGLARTQQLMGCDESATNCMAELADALGVDGVITGSIGQFGPTYQANVVIASNGNGKLLGNVTVKADSESHMLEQLTVGARQAAAEVGASLGKPARRFAQQAVYTDVLQLAFGRINLKYARALAAQWSLYTSFGLGVNQEVADLPGIRSTDAELIGEVRYHFFDTAPYGLYLGGGLGFLTGYGFGTNGFDAISFGSSAFALVAEAGYAFALFDFLHLSVGLVAFMGGAHLTEVNTVTQNFINDFQPVLEGNLTTGVGFAF
jgi:hypothetical protein